MRPEGRWRDRLLFIGMLLMAFALRKPGAVDATEAWLPEDALWTAFFILAFAGAFIERTKTLKLVRASWPLVALLLLIACSLGWSNEPATTARRAFALLGTTVLALYFVNRLGLRAFAESLATAIAIAAVASVPLIALFPGYALQEGGYAGAWRGCFFEKNDLGQMMALGIVTLVPLMEGMRGRRRALAIAGLVLFALLMAGSQSAGAIASTAIFAFAFPLWLWVRKKRSSRLALQLALVAAVLLVASGLSGVGTDQAFGLLGRDASLTGRTDVWQAAVTAIGDKPALGYGYREFWNKDGDSRYYLAPNEDGWLADTAHNGFLEVALDIGLIGEAVLVAFLMLGAVRATASFWRGRDWLSAWPLFAMFDVIFENCTDRSFATQNNVLWIVLLAAFWFATDALPARAPKRNAVPETREHTKIRPRQYAR